MIEEVKLAAGVLEILKEQGLIQKVVEFFQRKKPIHVLVVGASGTGKTALLNKLAGHETFIDRFERSPDVERRMGTLAGTTFLLETTPGQMDEVHTGNRLRAIKEAAASDHLGIVNVVSHGFHEGLANRAEVFDGDKIRQKYLEDRRKIELELLKEWTHLLCGPGGAAKWVCTVVSKADLWWGTPQQEEILNNYVSGDYVKQLGAAASLPHSVHHYSTVNQKFYDVVPTSGYYEDAQQRRDHNRLVATLIAYAMREQK